jgi:hypothetical protein
MNFENRLSKFLQRKDHEKLHMIQRIFKLNQGMGFSESWRILETNATFSNNSEENSKEFDLKFVIPDEISNGNRKTRTATSAELDS